MNHANGGIRRVGRTPRWSRYAVGADDRILAFVSRDGAESIARQWLAGVPFSNSNEQPVLTRSTGDED
jgi:hypothetical protein